MASHCLVAHRNKPDDVDPLGQFKRHLFRKFTAIQDSATLAMYRNGTKNKLVPLENVHDVLTLF